MAPQIISGAPAGFESHLPRVIFCVNAGYLNGKLRGVVDSALVVKRETSHLDAMLLLMRVAATINDVSPSFDQNFVQELLRASAKPPRKTQELLVKLTADRMRTIYKMSQPERDALTHPIDHELLAWLEKKRPPGSEHS